MSTKGHSTSYAAEDNVDKHAYDYLMLISIECAGIELLKIEIQVNDLTKSVKLINFTDIFQIFLSMIQYNLI